MLCARIWILSLYISGIFGWIMPRVCTIFSTNHPPIILPRPSLSLSAHLPKKSLQAPKGQVILVNEFITADPIRLIAPKVRSIKNVPTGIIRNVDALEMEIDGEGDEDEIQEEEVENEVESIEEQEEADDGSREEMLGIYSLDDALQKAEEMGLDLVMINEKADPPVCKIIDFGKFKYKLSKKKKDNQKKQVKGGIKEVKMSYKIGVHDFDVRVRAAQKFVAVGDRVSKIVLQNQKCLYATNSMLLTTLLSYLFRSK